MASEPISDVRDVVARLVDVCRAGQEGFELAARGVSAEPILRAELLQYSGQRQEFVAELNDALRHAGDEPIAERSATELSAEPALHDAGDLTRAVDAGDQAAILLACERLERSAVNAYRSVLNESGDAARAVGPVIHVQLQAITRVHDRIHSLRALRDG